MQRYANWKCHLVLLLVRKFHQKNIPFYLNFGKYVRIFILKCPRQVAAQYLNETSICSLFFLGIFDNWTFLIQDIFPRDVFLTNSPSFFWSWQIFLETKTCLAFFSFIHQVSYTLSAYTIYHLCLSVFFWRFSFLIYSIVWLR